MLLCASLLLGLPLLLLAIYLITILYASVTRDYRVSLDYVRLSCFRLQKRTVFSPLSFFSPVHSSWHFDFTVRVVGGCAIFQPGPSATPRRLSVLRESVGESRLNNFNIIVHFALVVSVSSARERFSAPLIGRSNNGSNKLLWKADGAKREVGRSLGRMGIIKRKTKSVGRQMWWTAEEMNGIRCERPRGRKFFFLVKD